MQEERISGLVPCLVDLPGCTETSEVDCQDFF